MRFTQQALAERKEKILQVAYELFCESGIDSVTLAQIAKKANVGVSAIYRYFETKANLLWYTQRILWKNIVEQINADVKEQLLLSKNGIEEVSILLYSFKLLYEQHGHYLLFANDYKAYLVRNKIKLPKQAYNLQLEPVREIFQSALRRGQADGSISSRETIDEQFLAIWAIMRGYAEQIVVYEKIYGESITPIPQFNLIYHYMLKGLEKEKGQINTEF